MGAPTLLGGALSSRLGPWRQRSACTLTGRDGVSHTVGGDPEGASGKVQPNPSSVCYQNASDGPGTDERQKTQTTWDRPWWIGEQNPTQAGTERRVSVLGHGRLPCGQGQAPGDTQGPSQGFGGLPQGSWTARSPGNRCPWGRREGGEKQRAHPSPWLLLFAKKLCGCGPRGGRAGPRTRGLICRGPGGW